MKAVRKAVFVADFESSTEVDYREDGEVRVYLWSLRDAFDPAWERHGADLESFTQEIEEKGDATVWFHNLKYDMSYYVSWLLRHGWRHVPFSPGDDGEFSCLITDKGQWMKVTVQYGSHKVDYQDSLKKFPGFSLETISRIYGIPGKADLDVKKRRPPGYRYTDEDLERVQGDTRILAAAISDLYERDMRAMTMASDAMNFFRQIYVMKYSKNHRKKWMKDFPDISEFDELWRHGYRGGWTYLNPKYKDVPVHDVKVYDVNSMYPWAMTQLMPVGIPVRRTRPSPSELYIMVVDAYFTVKPGRFPTWQRKGSFRSIQADFVEQSDGFETVIMTSIDREVFEDHYDVIYSGEPVYWCFETREGLFTEYIEYWSKMKEQASINHDIPSKQVAKRYLNSLYGKFGQQIDRMSRVPSIGEDGALDFEEVVPSTGESYLPIAMFITAYARRRIVRNADSFGDDFVYADTDSIHCVGSKRPPDLDQHRLGFFKLESCAHIGKYIGPKKYIHLYEYEVGSAVPRLMEVKCAGLPDDAKKQVTFENFRTGTEYEGKLAGRQVPGGYLLIETTYRIRVRNGIGQARILEREGDPRIRGEV